MIKEEYARKYDNEEQKNLARDYVSTDIPSDRPLDEKLHMKFIEKFKEK